MDSVMAEAQLPSVVEVVRSATLEVCSAVFASYGIGVEYAGVLPPTGALAQDQLMGLIGFSGPVVHGMLAVGGPRSLFEQTYPVREQDTVPPLSKVVLYDWVAELANQFLGRVSNRLAREGIEIALSSPSVLAGDIHELFPSHPPCERHVFRWRDMLFSVSVEIQVHPVEDATQPRSLGRPASEGEAILF